MDPVLQIIQNIEEKLDILVSDIILDFVEQHHIDLGREIWRENIRKVNKEYKGKIWEGWLGGSNDPSEDLVQIVTLTNWEDYKHAYEFNHDFSCRNFNYRDMEYSRYNTKEKRQIHCLIGIHS